MKKILKTLVIIIILAFILVQFIRPPKNAGEEIAANQITAVQQTPENIQQILKASCNDCHSNTTHYPWYDKIQPVAWYLSDHVIEGKKDLNFSEFANYPVNTRYKKMKEIGEEVKEGEMPMFSYTLTHRNAILSADQKAALINWAENAMKEMETKYPADILRKSN